MIESVSLRQMQRLHEIAKYDTAVNGRDFVFVHLTKDSSETYIEDLEKAFRFNGIILFIVHEGGISFSVNMERIHLSANQMLISGPNSITTVDPDSVRGLDAYALFISDEFIHDLNFEVIILNNLPITANRSPVFNLDPESVLHLVNYMELLDLNVRRNTGEGDDLFAKSISRSLLTATLYQIMILTMHRKANAPAKEDEDILEPPRPRSRRALYTHEFVRLVRKYFRMEHSVRFYANKLCISPKYLSLVVKECSGRTAAEIIDEYLLLEAKNMLRFSGKNIQQIAYELNFSNQSSFGKYFKHLTGMSPSEFLNS